MWINQVKTFILNLFFPQFCLNCNREGSYLCEDCKSLLEIETTHQKYRALPPAGGLKDLYFPLSYQNSLMKKLTRKFKYKPFIKELSKPLASLIITHFQLLDNKPDFLLSGSRLKSDFRLIPVPLDRKRLKWRGFNQAEEIGKELSKFFKIPLASNVLFKIKGTFPQVELSEEARKENIKGAFLVKNGEAIREKKILLVDDICTTGSTMTECARLLRATGAKEVIGIVIARG
jgi:ComF family protein